jgi:hypothetical protein
MGCLLTIARVVTAHLAVPFTIAIIVAETSFPMFLSSFIKADGVCRQGGSIVWIYPTFYAPIGIPAAVMAFLLFLVRR